ncbi:hypothetical protein [Desulforamulus ruminis]|nr:hypothetical protein [Desulforamulus ruminis]
MLLTGRGPVFFSNNLASACSKGLAGAKFSFFISNIAIILE